MEDWVQYSLGGGVVVLILVSLLLMHAGSLRKKVQMRWEVLREDLSLRHDLVPGLVEIVRSLTEGKEAVIQTVVDARDAAEHVHVAGLSKFETEMALSKSLNEMCGLVNEFPELGRDTTFLELRGDMRRIDGEIEKKADEYNNLVRVHNKFVKYIPFWGRRYIFEFES